MHCKEVADWNLLCERRAVQQTKDNERENMGRSNYEYDEGARVLLLTRGNERKGKIMGYEYIGPFKVLKVYNNVALKIQSRSLAISFISVD